MINHTRPISPKQWRGMIITYVSNSGKEYPAILKDMSSVDKALFADLYFYDIRGRCMKKYNVPEGSEYSRGTWKYRDGLYFQKEGTLCVENEEYFVQCGLIPWVD